MTVRGVSTPFSLLLALVPAAAFAEEPTDATPHEPETNLASLVSITALSTFLTVPLLHEGLGHGGATLATGHPVRYLGSTLVESDGGSSGANRFISLGATFVNLAVGSAALAILYADPPDYGPSYYFLWLIAATNLFSGAGYMMTPLFGFGDWAQGLDGLHGELWWKIGATAIGTALTFTALWLLLAPTEPLLGRGPDRTKRKWLLTLLPYFLGAAINVGAASLTREAGGRDTAMVGALAGSLGGSLFLAYLPIFFLGGAGDDTPETALSIPFDGGYVFAGAAAATVHVGLFGPGIGRAGE